MKANKAYKYRLYPTKEQEEVIQKTFDAARFIYNKMLEDKINYYKENKKMLYTTPAKYKDTFPWLKEVEAQALCYVSLNLDRAFNNFFKNPGKFGYPRFKSRHNHKKSYTTVNRVYKTGKNSIRIENNRVRLPKVGDVKIKVSRVAPDDWILKSVTISQEPSGKYFASFLYEYESNVIPKKPESFLGLDYDLDSLYVDSNGNIPENPINPKAYHKYEKKMIREQQRLSRKQKGSKNYEKQRIKLARVYEKSKNQRNDFLHKLSHKLADNYDCICISDINMQATAGVDNMGKDVNDNGWGMFTEFLNYKLKDRGGYLVKVVDGDAKSIKTKSKRGRKKKAKSTPESLTLETTSTDETVKEVPVVNKQHKSTIETATEIMNKGKMQLNLDNLD